VTELSGYVFSALRGGELTLSRGLSDGLDPILLVAPIGEYPARESLMRLEHEHDLRAELDAEWAVRPLALSSHDGRMALVLEDPGGEPLDRLLGHPMDVTQFLRIAIPLAGAVGQVHRRGLIHKDIKPANVLVDAAGDVRLTGFGIASRLPRERQAPAPPEIIAGTLAYMAPEQTGRMNRSIDARSDLYSLGATFYEMLTGVLPFTASDPMEWIHCHIARRPPPPSERVNGIPDPIGAIVLKLLAKTAEDRYQTAAGVEADLRRCLSAWQSHRRIEAFALAAHDVSDRLVIPEKLYGREAEIDALLAAFDRVVTQGTTELVLVSGYAGIGKSSIVSELHRALILPRGLFAAGKFDQYKRDIPYATLAQAFRNLVRRLLGRSEAELGRWRVALREALEPNGQLMVDLVPELELVIGEQPRVPELPPRDAQNRFQLVFRRFLGAFARPEHPLALFLDDLQWLDAATLDLLEHLLAHSEVRHLLLVGAYRDNEVSATHPLVRTIEAVRAADARVHDIVLAPLGINDIGQLVADTMHCGPERALPLAQLVQEKTGGNPFFAIQFFTALAEEGLLKFDPVAPAWHWDIDRIRAKSYTDNVVDLMAGRLKRLSSTTREALKQFACLGSTAEIATLALVLGKTGDELHAAFWEAVRAGLVFHQESTYKFLHDRIQQAAYSLIPDELRAEVHLSIGRVLLASLTADELAEHLFDIANQLSRGAARLGDRDEKAQVATIHLRAGQRAKASAAYESARAYFSGGMALLDEREWASQYGLTFTLWLERAECEFLTGHFETAEQLIGELLQRRASKADHAAVTHLKIRVHIVKAENQEAVDSALDCLRLFGVDLPALPTLQHVQAEYETVWQAPNGRPIEHLVDLPMMTDPELQTAMQLLSTVLEASYHTDLNLHCLAICRMANISTQHGMSGASAQAYGRLGLISGPVFHRYQDAQRFAKLAYDMVEKHGFIAYQAKAYFSMVLAAQWTQSITTAIDLLRAMFRTAIETGDLTCACYSLDHSVTSLLLRSDPLDAVWSESAKSLDFVEKARFQDVAAVIVSQQRFIATMQGRTATFSTFSDGQFDEQAFEAGLTGERTATTICLYWILKLQARFLSGDYFEALAAAGKAKALLWATTFHVQMLDYYYYTALTVAALYENGSADEQSAWRDLLAAHRERLHEWADNNPPTFADKYALVLAEIASLEGREADAMRLYEHAIQSARRNGFVQNEGLAHEVAARFYAAHGFETIAHAYLRNARSCYLRWGALGKVRQLEQLHPQLSGEPAPPPPTATFGTPVEQLDIGIVVKASQAVSGEIELGKLIETLMRIAIEHAGAERGLLILLRDDEPRIVAEATAGHGGVEVTVREMAATPLALPQSVLHYMIRTRESVVLDDASVRNLHSDDLYIRQKHPRSVLCLPVVKQTKLVGALYLENNLTPYVFTASRVAVLELMASQAAISLENARLYSERKQAEDELRRSEAYLAEAQRLSRTGSFGWSVATGQVIWSDETFRIFGYDKAPNVSPDWVVQRTHPDDRAAVQQTIDRAAGNGKDFSHEYRLLMPDRSVRHVHAVARAVKDASGNIEFVGAVTDVTAAKQAQDALRESDQRFRDYAEIASDWLWETGPDHRFTHLSEQLAAIGISPASRIGSKRWDFATDVDEEPEKWRLHVATLEAHRPFRGLVFRVAADSGSAHYVSASGKPVFDPQGRFLGYRGVGSDVTAAVRAEQAEEALRQSQLELAHATRVTTLGELTASIAHEVNQPLTAIVTNGEVGLRWLDREAPDLAEVREALGRVISNGCRAGEIIHRLRALSRKGETQKVVLDINELVEDVMPLVQQEVLRHQVSLRLELAPTLPAISADRVQLQQVIINLIVNGIEAMAPVTDRPRELTVRSQLDDSGQVLVAVEDAGVGIDPEHAKQIFNAFFTTKSSGMGMGLSICRSIVEDHGGRLWASRNAGPGATVQFVLKPHHEGRP
jgi:PAS domain S-box-containing protein